MSRLLMQRRHDVLKGGERQPLLIHEWLATSYDPATLTLYDTGAWRLYDGGTFDFVANSDTNFTLYDDYINFDGTASSVFSMAVEAVTALNLGKSIVVELDWMPEVLATGWYAYLTDFGSLTSVADGMCAFATIQHFSYLGFSAKYNSQSWHSTNGVSSTVNHVTTAYTRYALRMEWFNDGETMTIKYIINGEVKQTFVVSDCAELSWDRFDPDLPIYIGGGANLSFSYNKSWRFYSLRIYNYD